MTNQVKLLRKESYKKLMNKLSETKKIYAPVKHGERITYQKIDSTDEQATDFIIPDMSAKSFVFPKIEKLFAFSKSKDDVTVRNFDLNIIPEKVITGVRPCDALGMKSLQAIFGQDPEDPIFRKRSERTTIIGLSCNKADNYCFCTSINGGPGNTEGSDILLTETETGDYIVEIVTPKGEAIVALAPELFEDGNNSDKEKYLAEVPIRFDDENLESKIKAAFDTDIFDEYSMRCIGCAACAYVCPTCACFDIQDETKGNKGVRTRTWDSCGTKLFTLHTSGHNPRETQGARWRQRLMHKFSYMPEQSKIRGCVGCGRCSRRCPVDMNITENLSMICK